MTFEDDICPLCGGKDCKRSLTPDGSLWMEDAYYIKCNEGYSCTIHESIYERRVKIDECITEEDIIKRLNLLYLYLIDNRYFKMNWLNYKYYFYYDDTGLKNPGNPQYVNIYELMNLYPKSMTERIKLSLINLSKKYPKKGSKIDIKDNLFYLLYCTSKLGDIEEIEWFLNSLVNTGYLTKNEHSGYEISLLGWEEIDKINKSEFKNYYGFLAMAFKDETESISEVFKNAILKCGYVPRRIDEKEHNNQIVPEILYEISKSKFIVVDITYPNYGAYYEAGYAEALGKQVILCCREKEFNGENRPHFDVAQKSTIVWKDERDLEERLIRRIKATIGTREKNNQN